VILPDQDDGQFTLGQIFADRGFHFGGDRRQRPRGEDRVAVLLKIPSQGFALFAEVTGRLREIYRSTAWLGDSSVVGKLKPLQ